uniref:Histidine-rich glycoprotein-like n=1 Tax=Angiostrongylus cantonensis TaxID=6313 RepID=A0A0K0CZM1_ANGCA
MATAGKHDHDYGHDKNYVHGYDKYGSGEYGIQKYGGWKSYEKGEEHGSHYGSGYQKSYGHMPEHHYEHYHHEKPYHHRSYYYDSYHDGDNGKHHDHYDNHYPFYGFNDHHDDGIGSVCGFQLWTLSVGFACEYNWLAHAIDMSNPLFGGLHRNPLDFLRIHSDAHHV